MDAIIIHTHTHTEQPERVDSWATLSQSTHERASPSPHGITRRRGGEPPARGICQIGPVKQTKKQRAGGRLLCCPPPAPTPPDSQCVVLLVFLLAHLPLSFFPPGPGSPPSPLPNHLASACADPIHGRLTVALAGDKDLLA
ncbi:hypothetical protein ZWY2020_013498 [Hordeum vulgare]|nr:hypothetical protein ZWY2020_013498 [Hordeum vulgare]